MTVELILGIVAALITLAIPAGIGGYNTLTNRLTRVETLLEVLGEKTARLLHSPHDPYEADYLLDKYLDRHYELSWDEWTTLLKKCEEIESNEKLDKQERFLASFLGAICHHKLKHDPIPRKK